jgi:hydroxypyruvate reductase
VLLAYVAPDSVQALAEQRFELSAARERNLPWREIVALAAEFKPHAVIVCGGQRLPADAIATLPPGIAIIATASVGYEHVDLEAAGARGIVVSNTPDVLTDCTADLTLLLMLGACRRASEYLAIMQAGWRVQYLQGELLGLRFSGRTLGILGMGRIGRAVAQRARGFGMRVLYCNRTRLPPELENGAEFFAELDTMLPHCQILSVHAPATPATEKILDGRRFSLLPKGAVFINVARGALVDEDALIGALTSGHLFAAGLDVYRQEPAFDTRLAAFPNVFLLPHMGSATIETRHAMGLRALDNVSAVLAGGAAIDRV